MTSPRAQSGSAHEAVYGAAAERTSLAWQRTALGVVVGYFVVLHTALLLGLVPLGVIAALLGLVVAALSVIVVPSSRFLRGEPRDSWAMLMTVVGAIVGLAVLGAVAGAFVLMTGS